MSEQEIQRLRRHIEGAPHSPGLLERVKDLEDWKMKRVLERVSMKALVVGVSIGLGANLIGTALVLRALVMGG